MGITHARLSGVSNPDDPNIFGGEDWDAEHVIGGPTVVDITQHRLTTAGAILNTTTGSHSFTKTGTGTYRCNFLQSDFGDSMPTVSAALTVDSGAPKFVRWTFENDGYDYVQLTTIDSAGAAADVASATLTVIFGAVLT